MASACVCSMPGSAGAEDEILVPEWLAVLILFVGFGAGWVSRMRYDAEIRKDEKAVDDALARAWQAGWRSSRGSGGGTKREPPFKGRP